MAHAATELAAPAPPPGRATLAATFGVRRGALSYWKDYEGAG